MANENTSSGIGIGTILFLIFMTLKLAGFIDWSWWWVTSPLWIPLSLMVAIGGLGITVMTIINRFK